MRKILARGYRISKYVVYRETLVDSRELFWSFIGSFMAILCIGFIQDYFLNHSDNLMLIGSFGATAVLLYGAIQSPLAQPRNLLGGHIISAIIGVTSFKICGDIVWLAAAMAVSLSIVAMQITKTLHPPGGATALIAVIGSPKITDLAYWYVLTPVFSGVVILLIFALLFNNLTTNRKYPSDGRFSRTFKWVIKPAARGVQKIKR